MQAVAKTDINAKCKDSQSQGCLAYFGQMCRVAERDESHRFQSARFRFEMHSFRYSLNHHGGDRFIQLYGLTAPRLQDQIPPPFWVCVLFAQSPYVGQGFL